MTTATRTSAVDGLLQLIADGTGRTAADLYADDAVFDATVPGWRFRVCGNAAIGQQLAEWFGMPSRFDELERRATADGEVVTYVHSWVEKGVRHAARHCHVLTLAPDGRIARDAVFCGGRWDETLLARMDEADNG